MARISLKEAYDNRDVIAWLVKHEDEIDELMNILKDLNPSGDLTNIVTKTGDQTIDGIKTFIGKIVADCDIIQNGGNYETHAEQVFTTNDYIVMRDGAVSGLGTGQFSGFQVKKYNGSDDGRLVIDNAGVARVGDLGDEQPLLTRSESGQLNNGDLLQWNSTSQKAVSASVNTSQIVRGSGNIGSDTKPVKVVGGVAVEVSDALQKELTIQQSQLNSTIRITRYGKIVQLTIQGQGVTPGVAFTINGAPTAIDYVGSFVCGPNSTFGGTVEISAGSTTVNILSQSSLTYGSLVYLTNDP